MCGHRWAARWSPAGYEDTGTRLERGSVTQVGSADTRGWRRGVPGTRVQLQVRPRAQVASPPAPRTTEPPRTPPGRRGAARGDKDDRPPRDSAGQHGGRRPRGTGPRARAGPRSGGRAGEPAGEGRPRDPAALCLPPRRRPARTPSLPSPRRRRPRRLPRSAG